MIDLLRINIPLSIWFKQQDVKMIYVASEVRVPFAYNIVFYYCIMVYCIGVYSVVLQYHAWCNMGHMIYNNILEGPSMML